MNIQVHMMLVITLPRVKCCMYKNGQRMAMKRSVEIKATVIIDTPKNKIVTYNTIRQGTSGSVPKYKRI